MVPLGLVQKMYGKSTLLEQVQKLVSDALNDYMEKEAIHIIGEPLGSEEQQPSDWDNDKEFSFSFDLMLAPQVNVTLGKDVHMPYMRKKVTDKQVEEYRKGLLDQYGTMQDVEKTEKEYFLKVDVLQGENLVENTYLNLKTVDKLKDKKPFIGKTVGESVAADVSVLLPKEADRVALFQAKPEEWKEPEDPVFTFTIKEIKRFVPAEENQQLYDKLYGPGTVISAEAFVEKIKEQLERNNLGESDYQFAQEVRKRLVEQAGIRCRKIC